MREAVGQWEARGRQGDPQLVLHQAGNVLDKAPCPQIAIPTSFLSFHLDCLPKAKTFIEHLTMSQQECRTWDQRLLGAPPGFSPIPSF